MTYLTEQVADALRGLGVESDVPPDPPGDAQADLEASIPTHPQAIRAPVDIRWRSQPLGVAEATRWRERWPQDAILALRAIPSGLGRQYRALDINYVDSGGNAYLDYPGFHVHVEGRRPRTAAPEEARAKPASTNPAGLKVAFVLLVEPALITVSHDRLARLATVSKGSVSNILADLRRRGHVVGERGHRRLVDRERLAQDWIDGYVRDLSPRLRGVELTGPPPDWWIHSWTTSGTGVLGGGAALVHFGAALQPSRTVLYGPPPWREIRRDARLSREGGAPVVLRERFWSAELRPDERFVAPLLAYADALASGDPRETDAARQLVHTGRLSLTP